MRRRSVSAAAALAGVLGVATISGEVSAEIVDYQIVQAQSSLTVTGNLTNNVASQQTANSLTTSFTGYVRADLTPGFIAFPGGSFLDAAPQPVNQQPSTNGMSGSAPADYGRTAPGPSFQTTLEAIRGLLLDVEDDTFGAGIPVTSGNFASNSLVIVIDGGESDVNYGIGFNEISHVGKATANGSGGGPSTLTTVGDIETLTLKISTGSILYSAAQSNDSTIAFTGTIVATRLIPEPAAAAIVALGATMLLRRRR